MVSFNQKNNTQKILIVDDQPENIHILMEILGKFYKIIAATNGQKAIELAQKHPQPDLILLDVMMPDIDGYEVCRQLKKNFRTKDIPIIFVTALGEIDDEMKGLEIGAVDYLIKPINPYIVKARVKNHLTIRTLYQKLQRANSILEEKVKERTAQLEKMIMVDSLTGLPSKVALVEEIKSIMGTNSLFALIQLDFSRFSLINSSLGHEIGDRFLQTIALHIQKCLREKDFIARMGADNFYLLLRERENKEEIIKFAESILNSFRNSFKVNEYEIFVNCNLGIVFSDKNYKQELELLRDVDTALHKAKQKGQNKYYIFDNSIREIAQKRLQLELDLRKAIKEEQFTVFYQPIIDLLKEKTYGFEALIRWQHPTKGMISPFEFIPCLEESGLITTVGLWVFEKACQQQVIWQENFSHPLYISINLSPYQFSHHSLLNDIDDIIEKTGINPECIKIEITESALIENIEKAIHILNDFKARKIKISLDDFGTGYSSLSYLHTIPVDYLKIDRSFIRNSNNNQKNADLVEIIILLAHKLKMKVIAEGCETKEDLEKLKNLNCEYSQGYFFSKPIPAQETIPFLTKTYRTLEGYNSI
ncbi:EAL domain-containing protein [Cyanobacterium aponinum 0216]|uniref:EAL domain-containing protein n=1 Tax=Cyanobacterium aponinum 0216 TaxID=2676140 RepID=A0A844GQ86_9CHRO|nr:EAL domain-containing protein [Cyanobacterium aponinum 0216]